ncbi:MAG: CBS domain-containing protein [Parvicellaceae bacterium]
MLSVEYEIECIVRATDLARETNDEMKVSEIMTTRTQVVSVESGLVDAAKTMDKHQVHHVMAMAEEEVKGIISALDIVSVYGKQ